MSPSASGKNRKHKKTTRKTVDKKRAANEHEIFGMRILKSSHPDIRQLKARGHHPSIHGNKFWKSTWLIMDYLREHPPRKRPRVLEVGCGWGLAGLFCVREFRAKLTSLDADDAVFPYLLRHAELNGVKASTWKCRYENVRKKDLCNFDLIIGADICFWDEMTRPLFNLVSRAQKVGGVRVVLCDPGRSPFTKMAEKCVDRFGAGFVDWSVAHPGNASGFVLDVPATRQ